ncbi:MAG: DUF378 domain-containing protein [Candidatus Niyogibacteria bacterium]|nr:DUF378 domain-containing protein [Candidatus Niyogibacteria bacterium]
MKILHKVAFILLVIGGLNWLALAVFNWEVGALFGGMENIVSRTIYVLVGLSAIYEVVTHMGRCRECGGNMM